MAEMNRYGVANRLVALENAVKELRRLHNGAVMDGRDGAPGPVGPKGDRGDVLVIGDSEAAQAVIALRIRLKEQHAAIIAKLVESIEHAQGNTGGNWRHFQRLLEDIRAKIEALR